MTDISNKTALGNLILVASAIPKKVISAYDPSATRSANVKALSKFKLDMLEPCAEFLNIALVDDDSLKLFTKETLITRIILGIESLLPSTCSECSANYCVELAALEPDALDAPPFICHMCYQGSHNCGKIVAVKSDLETLNLASGHVWLCDKCHAKSVPVCPRKSRSRQVSISLPPSTVPSRDSSIGREQNEPSNNQIPDKDELKKKLDDVSKSRICKLYLSRNCPHGPTGKTLVNDEVCPDDHPKPCFRYRSYGTDKKRGCKKGKDCEYYHPTLCKFSVKYRWCKNESCTFAHLTGTSRAAERPSRDKNQNGNEMDRSRSQQKPGTGRDKGRDKSQQKSGRERDKSQQKSTQRSASRSKSRTKGNDSKQNGGTNARNRATSSQNDSFLELREMVSQLQTTFSREIQTIKTSIGLPVTPRCRCTEQIMNPHAHNQTCTRQSSN